MANRSGQLMNVYGMKGSGKTKFTIEMIKHIPRLIIFDPKQTYQKEKCLKGVHVIGKSKEAGRAELLRYLQQRQNGGFKVIYHPEPEYEVEELHHVSRLIEMLQTPYKYETSDLKVMLVVEEAHTASPNPLPKKYNGFARLVTMGRESGIDIIPVTQQPQSISTFIRDNADTVACFKVSGERAIEGAALTFTCDDDPRDEIRRISNFGYVYNENGQFRTCPAIPISP